MPNDPDEKPALEPEVVDETPPGPLILQLMPKVFGQLGAIGKDHEAPKYQFRSIEDVVNRIAPILIEHGVSQMTRVRDHRTTVATKTQSNRPDQMLYHAALILSVTFVAPDGSGLTKEAAGEGLDYGGDKATNKAMAAAYKYAIGLGGPVPFVQLEESDYGPKEPSHEQPTPSPRGPKVQPRDERNAPVSEDDMKAFWADWAHWRKEVAGLPVTHQDSRKWLVSVVGGTIDEAAVWAMSPELWSRENFEACTRRLRKEKGDPCED